MTDDLISVADAANESGKHISTITKAIRQQWLKATKFSGVWLIKRTDLQRWLNNETAHKRGRKRSGGRRKGEAR